MSYLRVPLPCLVQWRAHSLARGSVNKEGGVGEEGGLQEKSRVGEKRPVRKIGSEGNLKTGEDV